MSVLVVDLGSSSVRALLFDGQARPLAGHVARRPYSFDVTPDGGSSVAADQVRALAEACIDEVLAGAHGVEPITAVGMATFVGNLLGVDARGAPVTPVYTYADSRAAPDVEALRPHIDADAVHARTGCVHHTAYHPGRLHWLRRTQPERFAQVRRWLDVGAYVYGVWFGGDVPTSTSVASWSGLLDRERLTWDSEWLRLLEIPPEHLPPLADFDAAQRGLAADYARRWPVLADVPFYLAVGDGAAANIGAGGTNPDRIVLTVGTTAALRIVNDAPLPPVPPGLWSYRVDSRRHLIGGATSEGGSTFDWVRKTFALPDADAVEAALAARPADIHGLTFLPFMAGERCPGWQTGATGTIHGLRMATSPLDILQAALEGVALRLAIIAERLALPRAAIFAGGGALTRSPAWARLMASAFGRPLYLQDEAETTARGVALLALGLDGSAPPPPSTLIVPDPAMVAALRAARERQETLYRQFYGG